MLRPSAYIIVLPLFGDTTVAFCNVQFGAGQVIEAVIILGNSNEPARGAKGTARQSVHTRRLFSRSTTPSGRRLNGVNMYSARSQTVHKDIYCQGLFTIA